MKPGCQEEWSKRWQGDLFRLSEPNTEHKQFGDFAGLSVRSSRAWHSLLPLSLSLSLPRSVLPTSCVRLHFALTGFIRHEPMLGGHDNPPKTEADRVALLCFGGPPQQSCRGEIFQKFFCPRGVSGRVSRVMPVSRNRRPFKRCDTNQIERRNGAWPYRKLGARPPAPSRAWASWGWFRV